MSPERNTERQERTQRQMKEHVRSQNKLVRRKKVNKKKAQQLTERLHTSGTAKEEHLEELRMRKKMEE
eukprot:COSAG03_NODE_23647_length_278_cov_0.703911_1_plen_67_part_10